MQPGCAVGAGGWHGGTLPQAHHNKRQLCGMSAWPKRSASAAGAKRPNRRLLNLWGESRIPVCGNRYPTSHATTSVPVLRRQRKMRNDCRNSTKKLPRIPAKSGNRRDASEKPRPVAEKRDKDGAPDFSLFKTRLKHPDYAAAADEVVHAGTALHHVQIRNARIKVPYFSAKLERVPDFYVHADSELDDAGATTLSRDF